MLVHESGRALTILSVGGSSIPFVLAKANPDDVVALTMDGYEPDAVRRLDALWGKSAKRAGGKTNLLLSHLLDTAAVAELIWDSYLAPSIKRMLDGLAGGPGEGRRLFAWLCGVHDCGKATPAFQRLDDGGASRVRDAGLDWDRHVVERAVWRHDRAGGNLILRLLAGAGWTEEQVEWVWPLIAGHHGAFPSRAHLREPRTARGHLQGKGTAWEETQAALVTAFTQALGFPDLSSVEPGAVPSRATQLQLSGFVVMADWIASDERFFVGVDSLADVSMANARLRAVAAWEKLGLRAGWGALSSPGPGAFLQRFGRDPRPSQSLVMDIARRTEAPGLIMVEAPTGEGKTKAALIATEILASRFGADGLFLGMPTQATSDPMFTEVREWLAAVRPGLEDQVALLHGKRRFNKEWRELLGDDADDLDAHFESVEEDDPYGLDCADCFGEDQPERRAPAEWFMGRHRGLLSPFVVGTIDQLLFAATRTKHVMLRVAGLAGKVVVLDEVHAADVYMSQFLSEGLWWLGQAGVPVVLLSATLPPAQRRELVASYLAGAASQEEYEVSDLVEPQGYPSVTAAWLGDQGPRYLVEDAASWREDLPVRVEVLPEASGSPATDWTDESTGVSAADAAVVDLLSDRLQEGGCALVIRNTVRRAQDTFAAVRSHFGDEVRLLHGRLHAGHRADRTEECLRLLGRPTENGPARPARLIVVATQLAEQSFDVDADLLITDLAPIDLLIQRFGRVHRHAGVFRPSRLAEPSMVVTGFGLADDGGPPSINPESEGIYGRYLLLRTAALVAATATTGTAWLLPGQVPHLVAQVYDQECDVVPTNWVSAEQEARSSWTEKQRQRLENAAPFLLTRFGEHTNATLEGLHYGGLQATLKDEQFQALVRDGEPSVEVVLVRKDHRGFHTMSGRSLGVNGDASAQLVDEVLAGTVRLPSKLTRTAEQDLIPLDGWRDHPWLRYSRALILEGHRPARLGDYELTYDEELGLVVTGGRSFRR